MAPKKVQLIVWDDNVRLEPGQSIQGLMEIEVVYHGDPNHERFVCEGWYLVNSRGEGEFINRVAGIHLHAQLGGVSAWRVLRVGTYAIWYGEHQGETA